MKNLFIIHFLLTCFLFPMYAQNFQCNQVFTDIRDGQEYPTVQIGDQCWMAKNLNIGIIVKGGKQTNNDTIEKVCYNNNPANCDKYGGLYNWDESVNYSDSSQSICPEGWHLASIDEWNTLYQTVKSGHKLKSSIIDQPAWDGSNESGFSAIPGGLGYHEVFGRENDWAIFWTSTPSEKNYAWSVEIDKTYLIHGFNKDLEVSSQYLTLNMFSIRCIKNNK